MECLLIIIVVEYSGVGTRNCLMCVYVMRREGLTMNNNFIFILSSNFRRLNEVFENVCTKFNLSTFQVQKML